jgi:hypothetical protein
MSCDRCYHLQRVIVQSIYVRLRVGLELVPAQVQELVPVLELGLGLEPAQVQELVSVPVLVPGLEPGPGQEQALVWHRRQR